MALRKLIIVDADSFVSFENGTKNLGKTKLSINAYIKVNRVSGDKNECYAETRFTDDGISYDKTYVFTPSVEEGSPNNIKQAYQYLKTLPEFESAQDC